LTSTRLKTSLTGAIGNVLEWYDFAVFGFVAPFMSKQFFPASDKTSALIQTFGVFAAGYLARPIGGVLFGQIGDRLGRKRALQLSVALMAIPTSLITILPTHEQVGLLAPILLIALRLLQGLSVGGELIGSSTYLVEVGEVNRRASSGSWSFFGAVLGNLLGSGVAALIHHLLSDAQIDAWGWRIPFLGGLAIGVVGWQMRSGLAETAEFIELQRSGKTERRPAIQSLTETPLRVLQVAGIVLFFGAAFYTLFIWMPTYLMNFVKPPINDALLLNTLAITLMLVLMLPAGRLADRIGYKAVIALSILGLALTIYPLFRWIDSGSRAAVIVAMGVFAVLLSGSQAAVPVAMAELFPPRLRYSGTAIGYNLALALFGGTAPLVATWLIAKTGDLAAPAWYLTVLAIVSLLFVLTIRPHPEGRK
jgi:MHS family proline/betaine transporter-like MFS transporter